MPPNTNPRRGQGSPTWLKTQEVQEGEEQRRFDSEECPPQDQYTSNKKGEKPANN